MAPPKDDDDIELATLPTNEDKQGYDRDDDEENESDNEHDDEGSRALLGGHSPRTGPTNGPRVQLWPQIKNIVIESAPTLLLTTVGLLFTGELLDQVSRWKAMVEVDQLIMIIPVVLNLKGNLEMNLSARLGTAANMGELDDSSVRRKMIIGNLSLLQVQATVVSFVAACVSLLLGMIVPRTSSEAPASSGAAAALLHARRPRPTLPPVTDRKSGLPVFIMVASTAMSAACLSSVILGSFMCGLIVVCRHYGRDPDNIAPPVASCLGDLVTLILIGAVSTVLIRFLHTPVPLIICAIVVLSAISCGVSTRRNSHVRDLISEGWSPLFGAMIISSATGIVLDLFVSRYEGFALLAVVISGLPGSVGSIFVSRLSTALHAAALSITPITPEPSPRIVMITLIIVTIPVEIIFLSILRLLGWLTLPFVFVAFSVVFFCCAVTASLFIARALTNFLWSKKLDPDMYALPIHSALMDLIGQLLLVLCFEIVSLLGVHVRSKTPSTG
ncbi:solute carrier family 41 member 1 [Armillaria novae-zelandiae]|uniref:Solute carrier family 41 member 1 n=1 Tax=Armillaria novae-zelandiae TaxID=153914 RepID=A0AA39UA28_9AGAR|nr:solute carrier family 41 member 1 [Armillaria novae-zelandiae]